MFGWSAKCGCATIKQMFYFLQNDKLDNPIHLPEEYKIKSFNGEEDYLIVLFIRNPYKRIVSGYLDKYDGKNPIGRSHWRYDKQLTFENFVNELYQNAFETIDTHHFMPQICYNWSEKIENHKNMLIYDIENIDYEVLEKKFCKKIPDHFRTALHKNRKEPKSNFDFPIYKATNNKFEGFKPDYKLFYNEDIKNKIKTFYREDFRFFKSKGFDYDV